MLKGEETKWRQQDGRISTRRWAVWEDKKSRTSTCSFINMQGWGDMGPRAELIYLLGESHVTFFAASDQEVINYLSVNHQSAPAPTANHKLTLNLAHRIYIKKYVQHAHTYNRTGPHTESVETVLLTVCHLNKTLCTDFFPWQINALTDWGFFFLIVAAEKRNEAYVLHNQV